MPKWVFGVIAASVPILGQASLQVSGFQSIELAIVLWCLTGIGTIFLIVNIPPVARLIKWPLLRHLIIRDKGESKSTSKPPIRLIPRRKIKRIVHRTEVVNGKTKYTEEVELDP